MGGGGGGGGGQRERESARRPSLKGRERSWISSVRRTLEPFQRQRWGKLLRDGVECIIMGFSERIIDIILN